jgi:predicted secreted protein
MSRDRRAAFATIAATCAITLAFAAAAFASTWNFTWSGWRGGTRDSNTWSASKAGNHQWVKDACHADAAVPGGSFTVEIRRVRSLQPDQSLGTKTYHCNNTVESKGYASPGSGPHKFRFPTVSQGAVGISGKGHVSFP